MYAPSELVPYVTDSDSTVRVYDLDSLKQTYELEGMITSVILEIVVLTDAMLCN